MKPERIQQRLMEIPAWTPTEGVQGLTRQIDLPDALEATDYLGCIAAEAMDHERAFEAALVGRTVTISLPSSDADGLDEADFDLAVAIDELSG